MGEARGGRHPIGGAPAACWWWTTTATGRTAGSALLALLGDEDRPAHDGVGAVEVAEQFRPEVILMDVGMPR